MTERIFTPKFVSEIEQTSPLFIEKALNKLCNLKEPMPIAYISGAYRSKWGFFGVLANILRARRVAIKYWRMGYAVICPHMNTAFFDIDGKYPDSVWIEGDLAIIKRLRRNTDCLVMTKGFKKSRGSVQELALAKKRRLKIYEE